MKGMRTERVAEEIRHEIAGILQTRMRDPRVGMVSVTRVEVSPDLMHAKVYVSCLGDEEAQAESLRVVARAASFIRRELAHRLRARRVPELIFRADAGILHSARIQRALQDAGFDGAGGPNPSPADGEADGAPAHPDAQDSPGRSPLEESGGEDDNRTPGV